MANIYLFLDHRNCVSIPIFVAYGKIMNLALHLSPMIIQNVKWPMSNRNNVSLNGALLIILVNVLNMLRRK